MTFLPGEEKEIDVQVFAPTKGPLDLYILMDFSNSMADDLDNLKKMGNELASLVEKLSNDYTIGFGKFVDKVIEPQTDMRKSKLEQPWTDSDPPFSFENVIKLTSQVDFFTSELQKERISGNLDAPEGGFDAILQAAVCEKEIGWRPESTHLLVFSTESAFHYEADGVNVLAGILKRNDEQCHLDPSDKYTEANNQDYPSVPTLVRILGEHNIIPVFAVTNHSYTYYKKLQEYFPIAEVGLLQEDSSNILQVMEMAFEVRSIRSKMSVRAEQKPKAFEAQFLTTSGRVADYAQRMIDETPVCKMDPDDKEGTMRVKPTTFAAAVNVEASILCQTCSCEKEAIPNAARCFGHGQLVCGKCQCDDGWLGAFCNCSASTSALDTNQCIGPNMTEPCSGRGDCLECGTCVCYNPDQFEGPFCQYDKTQCHRFGGFLCNDRGSCIMGRCVCAEGWEGSACECPKSTQTCLDSKGGICNGRGECVCGRCKCPDSGIEMTATCEPNFQAQLGVCEATRSCVQCQAWKTGEKKDKEECDKCPFKIILVDELQEREDVLDSCSFRDQDDDCTFHYSVDNPKDPAVQDLVVEVLKKKDCPPASLLWLLPLILFLLLLLALLLLCCWKYCACCKACCATCCRMVGFKEDEYLLRQSLLTSDHLDTPMVRTGPPKGTDVVRWKVTDNVHRPPNHPQVLLKPNPKEMIPFPLSLRLNRLFSENLSRPESRDAEQLRKEVADNLNEVYKQIPGATKIQKSSFRYNNKVYRQDYTIMDTVLSAPRSSYPDIVKLTEKNVQSGSFQDLKVVPGYYTVATDRGAMEFQEGVESLDVHVPLFVKDEDDDKKQLLVEMVDVPLGIAGIAKRFVNITIIKEHASSVFSFLQPNYIYNRGDGVANIPISREIIEDGRTQVTYRTKDSTAKDKKDYVTVEGDLTYGPGETQKTVPVRLLELNEKDGLLEEKQVKQFIMDLSNPRQGAKLGRYPRTTVTIADVPETEKIITINPKSHPGHLGSPGFPKAKATGPRSIRLNWEPPPGSPMGYKVKYWIYGDAEKDAQVLDVKTPYAELTNLYPFCDYEMRVCAYNAMGDGYDTDMVTCQTLEDTPGEPGRLAFNVISPTVTQISWAEPAETNGNITAYEVVYTPIDDEMKPVGAAKKVKIDNPKKRMLLIENLQNAQTYQYKVRAKNSVGWGPFRDATINLASQPARPLSIPIIPDVPIVDAEAGDEYDSYLMYSNEVLKSPGGSKTPSVSGEGGLFGSLCVYYVTARQDPLYWAHVERIAKNFVGVANNSVTKKQNKKDNLIPLSTVSSHGINGETFPSPFINARLSPGIPDTPSRLVFSALGPTALKVSWQEPQCEKDILGYSVLYQLLNGELCHHPGPSAQSFLPVQEPPQPHARCSPFTLSTPSAPGPLVFTALSPDSLQLSWDKPRKPNGEILGYVVTREQLHGGGDLRTFQVNGDSAETSLTVPNLTENVPYKFKVQARTTQGFGPEREGIITIESQDGGRFKTLGNHNGLYLNGWRTAYNSITLIWSDLCSQCTV
uniref:Integrin beta n=1 Tax=Gouania willdenowi TaxID=441366 RepID=A0A8C5N3X1_GOUWI